MPHADHCSNLSNKQYSSCGRQNYELIITRRDIFLSSMSDVISLNQIKQFTAWYQALTCPGDKQQTLRCSWVLTNPTVPFTSEITLWYLSQFFSLAPSHSLFFHCCSSSWSYFFSLMWAVVGHFLSPLLLFVLHHCLQFGHERIWPDKSRQCAWLGEGHCPVHTAASMHEND